jgi:hypothetical protein
VPSVIALVYLCELLEYGQKPYSDMEEIVLGLPWLENAPNPPFLKYSPWNLVGGCLACSRRTTIVVFASEHIDRANHCINLPHPSSSVLALEVERQIALENARALRRI